MADVFYPQCWVRLKLRFEDYIAEPPPPQPVVDGDIVDHGGFVEVEHRIIPVTCSVTLNSYRNADEATVALPYSALPLDPRLLRACAIQVFMGTLDPNVHAESIGPIGGESRVALIPEAEFGVSNEVFRGFADDWQVSYRGEDTIQISARDITSILIDTEMPVWTLHDIPADTPIDEVIRLVVVGEPLAQALSQADLPPHEEAVNVVHDRMDVRRIENRLTYVERRLAQLQVQPPTAALTAEIGRLTALQTELTSKLAEAQARAAVADARKFPVRRFGVPGMRGLQVVNATGEPLPTLADVRGATWFDSSGKAKRGRTNGAKERISYWDFITDLVVGVGLIAYMRVPTDAELSLGNLPPAELVIDHPRTYYKERGDRVRTFAWGLNVESMDIQRNYLGRNAGSGVAVSAVEAKTGRQIVARWPDEPFTHRAGANPAGLGDRIEYSTVVLQDRIPGDNAEAVLRGIAQSIYEQVSKGEMVVRIRTRSLYAYPDNADQGIADMFQLRAGDPIEVAVVPTVPEQQGNALVTRAGEFWALSPAERARRLVETYGMSRDLAVQLVIAMESDLLQRVFYVREVGIDFDARTGFQFSIEAVNYLDARWGNVRNTRTVEQQFEELLEQL